MHRFVSLLNSRRLQREVDFERQRLSLDQLIRQAEKAWHGVKLREPDWSPHSHSLAFEAKGPEGLHVYLVLNAFWEPLTFELPPVGADGAGLWRRWIDTSIESPLDIVPWAAAPAVTVGRYRVAARAVVVLIRETAAVSDDVNAVEANRSAPAPRR